MTMPELKIPASKHESRRVIYIALDDVPNGHTNEEHTDGWADVNDPGTWIQPMRMDADTDNATAHWLLATMNGEEPKIRLTTTAQISAALIQMEIWTAESGGELDVGLEKLFDLLPAERDRKVASIFWMKENLEGDAEHHRMYARIHSAKAQAREKAVERIKSFLAGFMRQNGTPIEGKGGKISYRVQIPTGNASCYRHHADKVIFPRDFKAEARIPLNGDVSINFGEIAGVECLLLAVPVDKFPLSPELMNVAIEAKPNLEACRSAEPGQLPEGTQKAENWIVKSPSTRKGE